MLSDPSDFASIDNDLAKLESWKYLSPDVASIANSPRSLLLLSIPKSGTTWLRFLLINYAVQQRRLGADRIDYEKLKLFTAEREMILNGNNPVRSNIKPFLPKYGYDHLLFQHPRRARLYRDVQQHGGAKLLAYRNVLDYLVSNYYYFYEYRDGSRHLAGHPRDLIAGYVRYWALCWRLFNEKIIPAGRASLISYDALQLDTAAELSRALTELGITIDDDALERAIPMAAAKVVSKDETNRRGFFGNLDRGNFVRNGNVGQWTEHFTDADVDEVRRVLEACGVDPDDAIPN